VLFRSTPLFIDSAKQHDVVDRDLVGHRGVGIGKVETVYRPGRADDTVRFKTARAVERHDGIQIDIPGAEKPYGFPVDDLRVLGVGGRAKTVFEAPAGATVEIRLPPDHPQIPIGAAVYGASSQAVKRSYPFDRPKPAEFKVRRRLDVEVDLKPDALRARGVVGARNARETDVAAEVTVAGAFAPAQDAAKTEAAVLSAFEKLGGTRLAPGGTPRQRPIRLWRVLSRVCSAARHARRHCSDGPDIPVWQMNGAPHGPEKPDKSVGRTQSRRTGMSAPPKTAAPHTTRHPTASPSPCCVGLEAVHSPSRAALPLLPARGKGWP
jgi:hypothetical protein